MKRSLGLLAFLMFLSSTSFSQSQILKFKVNGVKDTTVHLAYYFGNKLYYADTSRADKAGNIVFGSAKKKKYDAGLYALVLPGSKYFEFIMSNENIVMETDTIDFGGKMVVKQSNENKLFYDYIQLLNNKKTEADVLREKLKALPDQKSKEAEDLKTKLTDIDKQVKAKQASLFNDNKNTLVSKIIRMSVEPTIPENPNPKDSLFAYRYAKEHYWDHLDFSDQRLVRCPSFHNRLDSYFKNMIMQHPDTMMKEADLLMAKLKDSTDMFKYVAHHLTYYFESSKVMCMDGAFVHMVNKYYKTGRAFWLDKDKLAKVIERANELSQILCGIDVHPLSLLDSTGKKWVRLYDIKADYTLLIFWDPDCGHCKKEMPKYVELYNRIKGSGFEIYSVSSDHNDKWKKFIKDNHMNFINVAVPAEVYTNQKIAAEYIQQGYTDLGSLNYRTTFDIYSTPKVFLLDKNKKIIAKQIEADQVEKLIEMFKKMKTN